MTAMRLAEHVEHTTDVDGMLDSMTPEQFNEWCAKDAVEPIGYQSQALGMIAHLIHCYMSQGENVDAEQFMPWMKYQKTDDTASQNRAANQLLGQIAGRMKHG